MELWLSISGEKRKLQGSFKSVMEEIVNIGKEKELKLLSVYAPKKELRRLKRELRKHNKNIYDTAKDIAMWFLSSEYRKAVRCAKYYKKKSDKHSKKLFTTYVEKIKEIEKKCEALKAA